MLKQFMQKPQVPGLKLIWTCFSKYIFLVKIIDQLCRGDTRAKINFKEVNIPGRTQKGMSQQWYKIKKEVENMAAGSPVSSPAKDKKPRTPRSRKTPTKVAAVEDQKKRNIEDAEMEDIDSRFELLPSSPLVLSRLHITTIPSDPKPSHIPLTCMSRADDTSPKLKKAKNEPDSDLEVGFLKQEPDMPLCMPDFLKNPYIISDRDDEYI